MTPIDQLKAVLCDPEGKCCIVGSDEDRAIVDRALEALAQPEKEPVAWLDPKGDQYCNVITDAWKKHLRAHTTRLEKEHAAKHTVPAFTTPPKRPWVGLTPDEINECYGRSWADLNCEVHTAVEAKLKEKNQ